MKPLGDESVNPADATVAGLVMETAFALVRAFRKEIRRLKPANLTLSQYRTLAFFGREPGASLSDLAEYLGLSLPSASKIVETLVMAELLTRAYTADDRRVLTITLTPSGSQLLTLTREEAMASFHTMLDTLSADDQQQITAGMQALQRVLQTMPAVNRRDAKPAPEERSA